MVVKAIKHRLLVISIVLVLFASAAAAELDIIFLNVGQGDCTIVICDGEVMIVDGGPPSASSSLYSLLRETPSLTSIRYVVATHPHDDHVGGLPAVLNAVQVDAIMTPVLDWDSRAFSALLEYAGLQGTPVFVPNDGDIYSLGGAEVEVLSCWPDAWIVNDMSICLRISYGDVSVILMGDAEYMTEYTILTYYPDLHADVLKAGHHGSSNSSTSDFVSTVSPRYAVISCGEGNTYGHPNREVLDVYLEVGAEVFRTDLQGTIVMMTDGHEISWRTERQATADELFAAPLDSVMGDVRMMIEDEEIAYVGNKNTHRFHDPSCPSVVEMRPENRVTFSTREEAIDEGYLPCGRCNP